MRALELSVPQIPSSAAAIDGKSGWASRQQRAERAAGLGATSYMGLRPDTPHVSIALRDIAADCRCGHINIALRRSLVPTGRERGEASAQRGPAWELKAPIGIEREIVAYCSDSPVKIMEQGTAY